MNISLWIIALVFGFNFFEGAWAFDCTGVTLPSSIVICSDPELRRLADERQQAIDQARDRLTTQQFKRLMADQHAWVREYATVCGMPPDGGPPRQPISRSMKECFKEAAEERLVAIQEFGTLHWHYALRHHHRWRRGTIFQTAYETLSEAGQEKEGYGLYSYVILKTRSPKAKVIPLLANIFEFILPVGQAGSEPSTINELLIPIKTEKKAEFTTPSGDDSDQNNAEAKKFVNEYYNFDMASNLIHHVCNLPDDVDLQNRYAKLYSKMRKFCYGEPQGPFILTYAKPASSLNSIRPPFVVIDFSTMPAGGFSELLNAFQEQVKREDPNDDARIDTFRLKLLGIILEAADVAEPVKKAVAELLDTDEDKKKIRNK